MLLTKESAKPRSKCTNAPDKLQGVLTVESSQAGARVAPPSLNRLAR
jgi:hypothetical protein